MKIIKRSGKEVACDGNKIIAALEKANNEVTDEKKLTALRKSRIWLRMDS